MEKCNPKKDEKRRRSMGERVTIGRLLVPEFGPEPSLVPLFVEALLTGRSNGKGPMHEFYRSVIEASPETHDAIIKGWEAMPSKEKRHRYGRWVLDGSEGPWLERVLEQSICFAEHRQKVDRRVRNILRRELDRAIEVGPTRWEPSDDIKGNKTLLYLAQKHIWQNFAGSRNSCCGLADHEEDKPEAKPHYGVKLSKISCFEQDEWGNDEIYIASIAVDGNGDVIAGLTPIYSMDDGDVRYPNRFLYPMKDPKGFVDVAIEIWDDDGGYDEAAKAFVALGAGGAAIGGGLVKLAAASSLGPGVLIAGGVLVAIAGLLALADFLDDDDRYGALAFSWHSSNELQSGVGAETKSIVNKDTGFFDITSYNYDVEITLLTSIDD
jgi:hypothetical protein